MCGCHFALNQMTPFWVNLRRSQELHFSYLDKFLHKVERNSLYILESELRKDILCMFFGRTRERNIVCVVVQELGQDILFMSRFRTRDWYLCKTLGQRWRRIFCVWPRVRARQGYVVYVFCGARTREGYFCILEPELEKDVLCMN